MRPELGQAPSGRFVLCSLVYPYPTVSGRNSGHGPKRLRPKLRPPQTLYLQGKEEFRQNCSLCNKTLRLRTCNRKSPAIAIAISWCTQPRCLLSIISWGPVPIRVHVAAPGNGKFVLFARCLVSSGFACARALSGLCPSLYNVWVMIV